MYFEREKEEEYPYFGLGTCFLCSYQTGIYAFTAHHVLREKEPEIVRILAHDEADEFLPFNLYSSPNQPQEEYQDFSLFRIAHYGPIESWKHSSIVLDQTIVLRGRKSFLAGSRMAIGGYPAEKRSVDYDRKKLAHQRVILPATYTGTEPEDKHIHRLHLNDLADINDLNGFSGSPVFSENDGANWGLAGLVIRGKAELKAMTFIDVAVLWSALMSIERSKIQT